jgi:hypothetical protein
MFWATVVLFVALVAYPLSYGPVCCAWWWLGEPSWLLKAMRCFYAPIDWAYEYGPDWVRDLHSGYMKLWPSPPITGRD